MDEDPVPAPTPPALAAPRWRYSRIHAAQLLVTNSRFYTEVTRAYGCCYFVLFCFALLGVATGFLLIKYYFGI